jgi:hypothetical protein
VECSKHAIQSSGGKQPRTCLPPTPAKLLPNTSPPHPHPRPHADLNPPPRTFDESEAFERLEAAAAAARTRRSEEVARKDTLQELDNIVITVQPMHKSDSMTRLDGAAAGGPAPPPRPPPPPPRAPGGGPGGAGGRAGGALGGGWGARAASAAAAAAQLSVRQRAALWSGQPTLPI